MGGLFDTSRGTTVVNQPAAAAPTPSPPPTMPDPMSPNALAARKNAMSTVQQNGRNSTILTTAATRAGSTIAGSYGSKLGAGGA